jgi:hypothetical protein
MHFFVVVSSRAETKEGSREVYVVAGYRSESTPALSSPTLSVIARCSLPFGSNSIQVQRGTGLESSKPSSPKAPAGGVFPPNSTIFFGNQQTIQLSSNQQFSEGFNSI